MRKFFVFITFLVLSAIVRPAWADSSEEASAESAMNLRALAPCADACGVIDKPIPMKQYQLKQQGGMNPGFWRL